MPTIVHIDVPADNVTRSKAFYSDLFGWKFSSPGFPDFFLFETTDLEGKPGVGGGMGKRGSPDQRIVPYIGVDSVDSYSDKVVKLGGKIILPKMTVPGFGYMAVCGDTEGNTFGLWQEDAGAR